MDSQNSKLNLLVSVIRIVVGLFFILSGILKMTDLVSFREAVENFNILPNFLINPAVIAIPSLEVISGIFLALSIFKKISSASLILLLFVFIIAIGINVKRGNVFDCGCLGKLEFISKVSIEHIIFNAVLLILLIPVFYRSRNDGDFYEQVKVFGTFTVFLSLVVNAPYSHKSLVHYLGAMNIKKIDYEKAEDLIETQNALIFDAREKNKFNIEHIPGALSFPLEDFKEHYMKYKNELNQPRPIIIYCDHSKCTSAEKLGIRIIQKGFKYVYTIKKGFDGWKYRNEHKEN